MRDKIQYDTIVLDYSQMAERLDFIEDRFNQKPALSIERLYTMLMPKLKVPYEDLSNKSKEWYDARMNRHNDFTKKLNEALQVKSKHDDVKFADIEHHINEIFEYLSLEQLKNAINPVEIAKLYLSFTFTKPKSFENALDSNPTSWLIKKIYLSAWHNVYRRLDWNFIAETYNNIRNFSLDTPGFEIDIDTASYHNNYGWSRNTRTYLDGELAFLVKYKGTHVLTVGFDTVQIDDKKIIEISQIQCKNKKGNRWIYKLPENYVSFVLKAIHKQFAGYEIRFASAELFNNTVKAAYEKELANTKSRLSRDYNTRDEERLNEINQEIKIVEEKLVEFDQLVMPRLQEIYNGELEGITKIESPEKNFKTLIFAQ